ncbi:MAG: hypothetical protein Q4C12_08705 [Clostridia bacterium]|nr:hypothetical protein [Clostridia bacterium]
METITERINKRTAEKTELEAQVAVEANKQIYYTTEQIRAFLYTLKRGSLNDKNNRKGLINIFLQAVYLWDDKFTLVLNGGDKPITIDDILLDEIAEDNAAFECSTVGKSPPP